MHVCAVNDMFWADAFDYDASIKACQVRRERAAMHGRMCACVLACVHAPSVRQRQHGCRGQRWHAVEHGSLQAACADFGETHWQQQHPDTA